MRILAVIHAFVWLTMVPVMVHAQGTGGSFTTPNGQVVPGYMVLVPAGPITNGQPVAAPPGPLNGLPVTCLNCSPSAATGVSSNPVNGTIAVTDTFQTLIGMNAARKGCSFQNQGTHTMYFSVASSPSLANSLQIPAGGIFSCSISSNTIITDAIQITSIAGDAFAGQWQ